MFTKFWRHTDRQAFFKKWSNRVQDISKHVNPSKIGYRKFSRIHYFLLMHIEESKKKKIREKGRKIIAFSNELFGQKDNEHNVLQQVFHTLFFV